MPSCASLLLLSFLLLSLSVLVPPILCDEVRLQGFLFRTLSQKMIRKEVIFHLLRFGMRNILLSGCILLKIVFHIPYYQSSLQTSHLQTDAALRLNNLVSTNFFQFFSFAARNFNYILFFSHSSFLFFVFAFFSAKVSFVILEHNYFQYVMLTDACIGQNPFYVEMLVQSQYLDLIKDVRFYSHSFKPKKSSITQENLSSSNGFEYIFGSSRVDCWLCH